MVSFDSLRRNRSSSADSAWKRLTRWLRRRLPMGLYARSLLIVVIPMVLLQSVVAFVFMWTSSNWRCAPRWRACR